MTSFRYRPEGSKEILTYVRDDTPVCSYCGRRGHHQDNCHTKKRQSARIAAEAEFASETRRYGRHFIVETRKLGKAKP